MASSTISFLLLYSSILLHHLLFAAIAVETEVIEPISINHDLIKQDGINEISSKTTMPANNGPSNGRHLTIMVFWFSSSLLVLERNGSGHVVKTKGLSGFALEYLAQSLHFTYDYVYDEHHPLYMEDQNPQKPGIINMFMHSNADVMMGVFGYTPSRNKILDYTLPTAMSSMALLIPKPTIQTKNYISAVIEPFQPLVWLCVGISLVVGVASLYSIWRTVSYFQSFLSKYITDSNNLKEINETKRLQKVINFMFGLILVQGSFAGPALGADRKLLAIRFLTGAWCLSCFVLVTAYSSVLVSFMTASESYKPIINSVNDLQLKRDVKVTVNRGLLADVIFQSAIGKDKPEGVFKFVGEQLNNNPEQRCNSTDKCLDRVRQGSSVYIFPETIILKTIGEEWKKTGQCDFTIAKERFLMTPGTVFLFKKNSPYTEEFNHIILRIQDLGLINLWLKDDGIDSTSCLKKIKQEMNNKKKSAHNLEPLTVKSLSGAFIVLGVGYSIAIATFIAEIVYNRNCFN